ncbi:putative GNAT superfamily acetyltransferase [Silvibacterium bohemicum]|uniref:Putative GNAT superfamily acetyltransferase n=1 Tax=Silvibacterium bohemicum TaxID=1577686 RepID=A0A841JR69_9BACT|nr:GNAT family N-acetyltransferase [Silvibacterium bohemicum]MBB6143892.1 putative GNAT superfamily acetyltransferase [Silvibacterium bohemicum]
MIAESPLTAEETFQTRDGRTIQIRTCESFEELDACVQLQVETWGYADGDVIPRRAFIVARRIGGQVIGAFNVSASEKSDPENGSLIGFAMALPGIRSRENASPMPYLHSHMLAVRAAYRNDGVGRRLKLFQRIEALRRGIELMEWTFDPLEIKNSFLNIHRLGAIVRSYTPNFYGVSSSRLQGGLPTDRLHAEWHLRSARVEASLTGKSSQPGTIEETILIPHQIGEWKSSQEHIGRALAVQRENRQRFESAFSRGLTVIGFRKDVEGNGIFELAPFEDQPFETRGL